MALPDLTPEQRAQALEKATQARRRRAEVKNALKARSMNLSEVLELADSDEAVAKMKEVFDHHKLYLAIDNLDNLVAGGRISRFAGTISSL